MRYRFKGSGFRGSRVRVSKVQRSEVPLIGVKLIADSLKAGRLGSLEAWKLNRTQIFADFHRFYLLLNFDFYLCGSVFICVPFFPSSFPAY